MPAGSVRCQGWTVRVSPWPTRKLAVGSVTAYRFLSRRASRRLRRSVARRCSTVRPCRGKPSRPTERIGPAPSSATARRTACAAAFTTISAASRASKVSGRSAPAPVLTGRISFSAATGWLLRPEPRASSAGIETAALSLGSSTPVTRPHLIKTAHRAALDADETLCRYRRAPNE